MSEKKPSTGTALVVFHKWPLDRRKKMKKFRSICEVLRELHRAAEERNDPIAMTKIEEAHDMAKRMQHKLEKYAGKQQSIIDVYGFDIYGPMGSYNTGTDKVKVPTKKTPK